MASDFDYLIRILTCLVQPMCLISYMSLIKPIILATHCLLNIHSKAIYLFLPPWLHIIFMPWLMTSKLSGQSFTCCIKWPGEDGEAHAWNCRRHQNGSCTTEANEPQIPLIKGYSTLWPMSPFLWETNPPCMTLSLIASNGLWSPMEQSLPPSLQWMSKVTICTCPTIALCLEDFSLGSRWVVWQGIPAVYGMFVYLKDTCLLGSCFSCCFLHVILSDRCFWWAGGGRYSLWIQQLIFNYLFLGRWSAGNDCFFKAYACSLVYPIIWPLYPCQWQGMGS